MAEKTESEKIPVRLDDDERRLIAAIRGAISLGKCPDDLAAMLHRLLSADLKSPDGKWMTEHGFFLQV